MATTIVAKGGTSGTAVMQKTGGTFHSVAWTYLTQKTTTGATVAIQKTGGSIHGTTYTEVKGH